MRISLSRILEGFGRVSHFKSKNSGRVPGRGRTWMPGGPTRSAPTEAEILFGKCTALIQGAKNFLDKNGALSPQNDPSHLAVKAYATLWLSRSNPDPTLVKELHFHEACAEFALRVVQGGFQAFVDNPPASLDLLAKDLSYVPFQPGVTPSEIKLPEIPKSDTFEPPPSLVHS
jgi:hypothetical protein